MITRPPMRPQSLLRAFVKQTQTSQCRRLHTPPQDWKLMKSPSWQNQKKKQVFDKYGVPGFLSKECFNNSYNKYIEHLAARLNEFVAGTADEGVSAMDLHKRYAHVAQKAALYNHAAMAIHTQFFFEGLAHAPSSAVPRTPGINTKKSIETHFDSVDQLRTEFLDIADSVFGNGFVWLMLLRDVGCLSIMATYNAGSPWPGAAPRRDNRDMANIDARQLAEELQDTRKNAGYYSGDVSPHMAGSFGNFSANRARFYEGHLDAEPILCVNLWQHQWLPDYGQFGRREYLTSWWDTIDWGEVEHRYSLGAPVNESRLRPSMYEPLLNKVQQDQSVE